MVRNGPRTGLSLAARGEFAANRVDCTLFRNSVLRAVALRFTRTHKRNRCSNQGLIERSVTDLGLGARYVRAKL